MRSSWIRMPVRRWLAVALVVNACVAAGAIAAGAAAPTPGEACAYGYALLDAGDVDEAEQAFLTDAARPECARGLDVVTAQRARAASLATQCVEGVAGLAEHDPSEDWADTRDELVDACTEAIELDRAHLPSATKALAELADAPSTAPTGPGAEARDWWKSIWEHAQEVATTLAQLLLGLFIALPILNALGVFVGRRGPRASRRELSRSGPYRLIASALFAASVVAALTDHGHEWWWSGLFLLGGAFVLWMAADDVRWFVAPSAAAVVGLGYEATDATWADSTLAVGTPALSFVLLAWVLAQRRRVRFEAFQGTDGSATVPIAPLIATELVNLATPHDGDLNVVDPFSAAELDGDAVSVLSGPENKIVAAALKVFRTLLQPGTDWFVTGQLVGEGSRGVGIALQLKYGRSTVAATVVHATTYSSKTKLADGSDPKPLTHAELAHPAAAWILIELLRELEGGDLTELTSLDGATVPAALALHAAASQAQRAGESGRALELFAKAIDADPGNLPARIGFAIRAAEMSDPDDLLERIARTHHLNETMAAILDPPDTPDYDKPLPDPPLVGQPAVAARAETKLMARHARVVANVNLMSARALPDGRAAAEDQARLARVQYDLQLLGNELDEHLSTLSPTMRLAFEHSLRSLAPIRTGNLSDAAWLRSVRQSARSAYNGAGLAATPLVTESQPEICIDLLRVAAVHERYRRAASGDPSFRLVKDRDDFQQLVGGPEPASDGLASIDAIGGTYAKSLAKIGVTTFAQLAATDLVQLATATKAPPALVAVWKDLARIDAIDGIGFRYTNVLARCGVRTLRQLAAADPHRLAVLAAGMSTAGAAKQAPDAASVAAWVAAARSTS